jgi:hypothetical protein
LRLYEAGYDSVYVKDSFGRGLMPDTLSGYMTQRFRWVYGADANYQSPLAESFPNQEIAVNHCAKVLLYCGLAAVDVGMPWR